LLVNLPSPHLEALTRPSTLKTLQARAHTPTPYSVVFTFGFAVEFIKELGGVSSIFNNGSKGVLNDIMKNYTFPSMGTP